jgi:hypothetical protein
MENLRKKNQTEILELKSPFDQKKNTMEDQPEDQKKWETESQSLVIK